MRRHFKISMFTIILLALVSPPVFVDASVENVTVLPTCTITPNDRVILEILLVTAHQFSIAKPTQVRITGAEIDVDVFPSYCYPGNGVLPSFDSHLATAEIGRLAPGAYTYRIHSRPCEDLFPETPVFAGSIEVVSQLCPEPDRRRIYWADAGIIKRASPDGTRVEGLVTGPWPYLGYGGVAGFAVDQRGAKMYWCDSRSSMIERANLDGSMRETVVLTEEHRPPSQVALDPKFKRLYWIEDNYYDRDHQAIWRANLDGSAPRLIADGQYFPESLMPDPWGRKVYWVESFKKIRRANVDGSNFEDFISELYYPRLLGFDPRNRWVYWSTLDRSGLSRAKVNGTDTDLIEPDDMHPANAIAFHGNRIYWSGGNKVQRANADGTSIETIVSGLEHEQIVSLQVDSVAKKLYWIEPSTSFYASARVKRAEIDGSNVEAIVNEQFSPFGLTIHRESSSRKNAHHYSNN